MPAGEAPRRAASTAFCLMPAGFTGCKPKAWCHRFELAFSQVRPDEKKESAIAFLKDAVTYYHSLGMKITGITLTSRHSPRQSRRSHSGQCCRPQIDFGFWK